MVRRPFLVDWERPTCLNVNSIIMVMMVRTMFMIRMLDMIMMMMVVVIMMIVKYDTGNRDDG